MYVYVLLSFFFFMRPSFSHALSRWRPLILPRLTHLQTTSEASRIIICCIVHPILQESFLLNLRTYRSGIKVNQMDHVYSSQFVTFLIEMLLVLYRRSMIVSLRTQTSVMIGTSSEQGKWLQSAS